MPDPIEETIHIDAPPEAVWAILSDIQRWPEWTPSMKKVEREGNEPLAIGGKARLWIAGARGASTWTVTSLEPGRSFTWTSGIMPGVTSIADHELAPDGAGTSVTLRVSLSGPLAPLAGLMLANVSRRNVHLEAEGLKRRSEARTALPTQQP